MRALPAGMIRVLTPFAPLFSERVFEHVQVLVAGAVLTPGKRTVSSALRAMGLDQQKTFHRYHRVLSHAVWSSRKASRVLLDSLVEAFVAEGEPLVVGIDETLERRQGKRSQPRGSTATLRVPAAPTWSKSPSGLGRCSCNSDAGSHTLRSSPSATAGMLP
jgi:hypothetical protein